MTFIATFASQHDVPVESDPGSLPVEPDLGPATPVLPPTPEGEPLPQPKP